MYKIIQGLGYRIIDIGERLPEDSYFTTFSANTLGLDNIRNWTRNHSLGYEGDLLTTTYAVNIRPGKMPDLDDGEDELVSSVRRLHNLAQTIEIVMNERLPTGKREKDNRLRANLHKLRNQLPAEFRAMAMFVRDQIDLMEMELDEWLRANPQERLSFSSSASSSPDLPPQPSPASPAPTEP
jgi:hypothetical protein